ncbi:unnamed protein product [Cuscuta epithymum]|uniref:Uncharacterized protein n=1 Tax=Cuscuta epithymum TaxID=186058 RepID=A0AAV0F393_9ASTE|nr:unnamed protein product [Cuscuta epithymum]
MFLITAIALVGGVAGLLIGRKRDPAPDSYSKQMKYLTVGSSFCGLQAVLSLAYSAACWYITGRPFGGPFGGNSERPNARVPEVPLQRRIASRSRATFSTVYSSVTSFFTTTNSSR